MIPPYIAGTWKLINWRQPGSDPEHPFGLDPVGYLAYHPESNYVALQVMKAGRPRISVANDSYLRMSSADEAAAAKEFFGYTGQSTWQDDIVTHNIEVAFNPSLVGQQQAYRYHLSEDTLTLSVPNGTLQTTWQRANHVESSSQILPPSQLVGIWKLVSMYLTLEGFLSRLMWIMADRETPFTAKLKGKPIIYPHGQNARGYLMYNEEGYMSVHVMNANRPHLTTADEVILASDQEKAQAVHTYLSYAGPYRVQGSQVIHQPDLSLFPNFVGTDLVRFIELAGTQLTLSTLPTRIMGVVVNTIAAWEQVA